MNNSKKYLLPALTFLLGIFLSATTQFVFAHGGDASLIHGCVRPITGLLRIIGLNDDCRNGETPLDWNIQGPPGPQGPSGSAPNLPPFICASCDLSNFGADTRFAGKDYTNAIFGPDGTNTNFSNSNFTNIFSLDPGFQDADLSNSNFTNAVIKFGHLNNANFQGSNFLNANLSEANFTEADLTGATNMDTANLTGVIWSNTTCPDGTNSDSNGGTCVGHL